MTDTSTRAPRTAADRFPWLVLAGTVVMQGATAPGQTVDVFGSYEPALNGLCAVSVALAAATLLVDPPTTPGEGPVVRAVRPARRRRRGR